MIAAGTSGSPFFFGEDLFLGTGGQGLFEAIATPMLRVLPALVDTVGATGQRFRTEITIGNLGPYDSVGLYPTGGYTTVHIPLRTELRAPDAVSWLRSMGLDIPASAAVTGLTIPLLGGYGDVPSGRYILARVYTTDSSGGTYGVMLEAPTDIDAAEEEASVYGLRSAAGVERSNLAIFHVSTLRSSDPITLSLTRSVRMIRLDEE